MSPQCKGFTRSMPGAPVRCFVISHSSSAFVSRRERHSFILHQLRGLEHVIEVDSDKNLKRWKHIRTVLGEINRQREENAVAKIDWEKVRQASLTSSKVFYEHAVAMGKKDEEAKERAWNKKPTAPAMKPDETPGKQKDTAKRRGLMFWKK